MQVETVNKSTVEVVRTSKEKILQIFETQQANAYRIGNKTYKERKQTLQKLHDAILKYRPEIKEALYKDYRKHPSEVDLTEIFPITSEIKDAKSNLRGWMKKKSVGTPLALLGSSSHIRHEPKGVVLIISPWNFPFNLTFGPLVSALAAGNTVIIKPSELTPHSSALIKKIIDDLFDESEVAVVEGGVDESTELLKLPFNHIFFTGSPNVGKIVMRAAAEHLTSVTLELGGKSPTVVDETADIKTAARRIAWGKYINNGQVCIAPDYVFVHEKVKTEFVSEVKNYINDFYKEDASKETSYARIVNNKHFNRVNEYLQESKKNGANIIEGGNTNDSENYIAPTVIDQVSNNSKLMENEIFGPILPVFAYSKIDEVIEEIQGREKPLALYIFSKNKKNINKIMANTRAGGTCVNHTAAHFFNVNLPFGGSNNSGIGKAHGYAGFQAFSNERGVLKQHIPNALELLLPPYNDTKQKIIDLTIKYF